MSDQALDALDTLLEDINYLLEESSNVSSSETLSFFTSRYIEKDEMVKNDVVAEIKLGTKSILDSNRSQSLLNADSSEDSLSFNPWKFEQFLRPRKEDEYLSVETRSGSFLVQGEAGKFVRDGKDLQQIEVLRNHSPLRRDQESKTDILITVNVGSEENLLAPTKQIFIVEEVVKENIGRKSVTRDEKREFDKKRRSSLKRRKEKSESPRDSFKKSDSEKERRKKPSESLFKKSDGEKEKRKKGYRRGISKSPRRSPSRRSHRRSVSDKSGSEKNLKKELEKKIKRYSDRRRNSDLMKHANAESVDSGNKSKKKVLQKLDFDVEVKKKKTFHSARNRKSIQVEVYPKKNSKSQRSKTPRIRKQGSSKRNMYKRIKKGVKTSSSSYSSEEAKSLKGPAKSSKKYLDGLEIVVAPRFGSLKHTRQQRDLHATETLSSEEFTIETHLAASSENEIDDTVTGNYASSGNLSLETIDSFAKLADSSEESIPSDTPLPKLNFGNFQHLKMNRTSIMFADHKIDNPMGAAMNALNKHIRNPRSSPPIKIPSPRSTSSPVRKYTSEAIEHIKGFKMSMPEFSFRRPSMNTMIDFDAVQNQIKDSTGILNLSLENIQIREQNTATKQKSHQLNHMMKQLTQSKIHMTCNYCQLPILFKFRSLGRGKYHAEHLFCSLCEKKLYDDDYRLESHQFYCLNCYLKEDHQGTCKHCQLPIYGSVITVNTDKYHPLHYN